ncbi:SusC/RagA family TonB-linked outer membrane protein [Pedobacter polaris]|uniref:SusC/RagA family TonB-linked outer membrane protein n=1 Tax=Pedobacter polaris TaxID=2571273 RepID=A0A4U1CK07_9SPHI|nr:SusC/RagA family TonB-linked outer membrane protein [Pedobacter polaris]TKC07974.1 SusC/RagA family TonB-linked outer membrane protein [Pedobacter polaris]
MKINLLKTKGLFAILLFSGPAFSMDSGSIISTRSIELKMPWQHNQVLSIVTGTVVDNDNQPVPGVGIKNIINGKSAITDANGKFSIETVGANDILRFSYIGFVTQDVTVGTQTSFNIKLVQSATTKLNEVVVVGYGTQTRNEITSAITKVDSADFRQSGSRNPLDLLIGKVAGLQITRTGGTNPNSGVGIQLRGVTTLAGAAEPLIIIDGIPGGNLDLLQQDDIESFSVLKDGSAAAIYGTRANAGVIIVTTKKGKRGPSKFDYNSFVRTETLVKRPDFMTAAQYRERLASGQVSGTDYGGDFDYFDELINKDNLSHNHNFAVSGGGENSFYRASVNFRDVQGFARENARKEYGLRLSLTQTGFENRLTAQFNVAANFNNANLLGGGGWETVLTRNPTESYYNPDGTFKFTRNITNEIARLEQEKNRRQQQTTSIDGKVDFLVFKGLKASVFGAHQRNYNLNSEYRDRASQNSVEIDVAEVVGGGYASRSTSLSQNFNVEPTLEYNTVIGNQHKITAVAGYFYRYEVNEGFNANNRGYLNDIFEDNNLAAAPIRLNVTGIGSNKNDNTLIAGFARVSYAFGDRFFAQASIRREGSSRFGANNKWATFPAVSGGWNVTQENFMKNVKFVNNLKIRLGYGETGNSGFANYSSLVLLGTGGIYLFPTGSYLQTYGPTRNPNPNLRWERKKEMNLGIDFTILNNKLTGSIDLYNRTIKDLIDTYTSPQPPFIVSSIITNVGTISAKGIEITLGYMPVKTDKFSWNIDFAGSTTRNVLDRYSNDEYKRDLKKFGAIGGFGALGDAIRTYEGRKVGEFWGKRFAGFTPDGKWTFYNRNGDVVSNAQINTSDFRDQTDLAVIGNAIPKYYLSLTNSFTFKGFDFRVFLRSKLDYDILNTPAISYGNKTGVSNLNLLNSAYTKYAEINDTYMYSDYYVESGSFMKIDEVTLGYTFKTGVKSIRNLRAYVTGQNLATITGYTGNDPDFVSDTGLGPGIDSRSPYPSTRQFLFGVSFGF